MIYPIFCFHQYIFTGFRRILLQMVLDVLHPFLLFLCIYEEQCPSDITGDSIELITQWLQLVKKLGQVK